MANNHGGKRSGAGRKTTRDRYDPQATVAEGIIADALEDAARNLVSLANGGIERIEEKSIPACQMTTRVVLRDKAGNPIMNKSGTAPVLVELPINPKADPSLMVVVERKRTVTLPDREANVEILSRVLGKPIQAAEISGPGGEPLDFNGSASILEQLNGLCDTLRARRDRGSDNAAPGGDSRA